MQIASSEDHTDLREAVQALCAQFDGAYWRRIDEARGYPDEFADALTKAGWMAALVPAAYGGSGLGLTEASIIMEEINKSGGNSGAVHGQMYNMSTLLRAGSDEQKQKYLPRIASGEWRLQSMAVTEPTTGSDTTKLKTTAVKKNDRYIINGQKVWTSRLQHSELMILLARTTPLDMVKKRTDGLSVFIVDVKEALGKGMSLTPIRNMVNHETNQVFFDDLEIPAENLIGEEGQGFRTILAGLNAERVLIAAECIGDGYWFVEKARAYAGERVVFDRPIGMNQGIQFPIARAYVNIRAADLMRYTAAALVSPLNMMSNENSVRPDFIRSRRSRPIWSGPTSPSMCSACRVPTKAGHGSGRGQSKRKKSLGFHARSCFWPAICLRSLARYS